jgi:hypothetical protein
LKNTQTTRKWTLDTANITEDYKSDIQKKVTMLKLDWGNSENTWKVLKDTIIEAADKHILKKGRKKGPTWISQDTLRVVARRRQMKVEEKWAEATKLNEEIKKRSRKDKEKYFRQLNFWDMPPRSSNWLIE